MGVCFLRDGWCSSQWISKVMEGRPVVGFHTTFKEKGQRDRKWAEMTLAARSVWVPKALLFLETSGLMPWVLSCKARAGLIPLLCIMIPSSTFTSDLNFPFFDVLFILLGSLSKKKTYPEEKTQAKSNWLDFPSAQCWEANLSSFCQLAVVLMTGFQDQSKPFNFF